MPAESCPIGGDLRKYRHTISVLHRERIALREDLKHIRHELRTETDAAQGTAVRVRDLGRSVGSAEAAEDFTAQNRDASASSLAVSKAGPTLPSSPTTAEPVTEMSIACESGKENTKEEAEKPKAEQSETGSKTDSECIAEKEGEPAGDAVPSYSVTRQENQMAESSEAKTSEAVSVPELADVGSATMNGVTESVTESVTEPVTEPVTTGLADEASSVAHIDKRPRLALDEHIMRRSRNLFGHLMGHLQKAKVTLEQEQNSRQAKMHRGLESRVEERIRKERLERREMRVEALKRQQEETETKIKYIAWRIDCLERLSEQARLQSKQRHLQDLIATQTKPTIYWKPRLHTSRTRSLMQQTSESIEKRIRSLDEQIRGEQFEDYLVRVEDQRKGDSRNGDAEPQTSLPEVSEQPPPIEEPTRQDT